MTATAGTELTCTNPDCPCRLTVQVPCPHGDRYTCACGHPLEPIDAAASGGIAQRAEEAGIVDQQAAAVERNREG